MQLLSAVTIAIIVLVANGAPLGARSPTEASVSSSDDVDDINIDWKGHVNSLDARDSATKELKEAEGDTVDLFNPFRWGLRRSTPA